MGKATVVLDQALKSEGPVQLSLALKSQVQARASAFRIC
jgi:hypothetical protein